MKQRPTTAGNLSTKRGSTPDRTAAANKRNGFRRPLAPAPAPLANGEPTLAHGKRRDVEPAGIPPAAVLQRRYQALTRKHFTGALSKLFTDCTGLRFYVSWRPPPPLVRDEAPPAGCDSCLKRVGSKGQAATGCEDCLAKHFPLARQSGCHGYSFTCPLGVANFWVPMHVKTICLGMVCFQAHPKAGARRGKTTVLPALSQAEFDRAARLLRLIAHDVLEATLAELEKEELRCARRSLRERERTESRLRQELRRALPAIRANAVKLATETHGQQIVREMLEYINLNYGRPVQLKDCAGEMRRNAACLSALFSRTVGLPFKRYLTELRLERAQELLSDPRWTIAEVAYSVGYTDPNRFRLAFKQWAGLPPSGWRGSVPAARLEGS